MQADEQEREARARVLGPDLLAGLHRLRSSGIVAGLSGCASSPSPRSEVCYMQLIGRTQDEMPVVRNLCLTEEQFAESQK
jgi:hypothetical protein